jgi:hypothetical protein
MFTKVLNADKMTNNAKLVSGARYSTWLSLAGDVSYVGKLERVKFTTATIISVAISEGPWNLSCVWV